MRVCVAVILDASYAIDRESQWIFDDNQKVIRYVGDMFAEARLESPGFITDQLLYQLQLEEVVGKPIG